MIQAGLAGIDAREVFNDREYYPAGSDELIDADVSGLEITAAEVLAAMVLFENFLKFLDDQAITADDYRATLNAMRTDL